MGYLCDNFWKIAGLHFKGATPKLFWNSQNQVPCEHNLDAQIENLINLALLVKQPGMHQWLHHYILGRGHQNHGNILM